MCIYKKTITATVHLLIKYLERQQVTDWHVPKQWSGFFSNCSKFTVLLIETANFEQLLP